MKINHKKKIPECDAKITQHGSYINFKKKIRRLYQKDKRNKDLMQ